MTENDIKSLYRIGGISALVQLATILISIVFAVALGPRPMSATDFFAIQQSSPLAAMLLGDLVLMFFLFGEYFGKVTAISRLLGNTLDLVQHLLHPFAPSIAEPIKMVIGIFDFVWDPMLARDFFRLAKGQVVK